MGREVRIRRIAGLAVLAVVAIGAAASGMLFQWLYDLVQTIIGWVLLEWVLGQTPRGRLEESAPDDHVR